MGGLYPALRALQEIELRRTKPQYFFAGQFRDLIPKQLPRIQHTLTVGVVAAYTGGVPVIPRTRGLPYQSNDVDHCTLISEKFRKDILMERMFVCTTQSVGPSAPVEATPTTMVARKIRIAPSVPTNG